MEEESKGIEFETKTLGFEIGHACRKSTFKKIGRDVFIEEMKVEGYKIHNDKVLYRILVYGRTKYLTSLQPEPVHFIIYKRYSEILSFHNSLMERFSLKKKN
jgi:hypothetical protein